MKVLSNSRLVLSAFLVFFALTSCKPRINRSSQALETSDATTSDSRQSQAIPEIMGLDLSDPLPKLPHELLEKYDSRSIAESIVLRIHKRHEEGKSSIKEGIEFDSAQMRELEFIDFDWHKETKIAKFFNAGNIGRIIDSGFLNLHQTGTSEGINNREARVDAENVMSGLILQQEPETDETTTSSFRFDPKHPIHVIQPKYSTVIIDAPVFLGKRDASLLRYGDSVVVFKDEVKKRSTWTYGDSLSAATYVFDPMKYHKNYRYFQGTFFSKQAFIHSGDGASDSEKGYFEVQTWGELDIRDVAYFLVRDNESAAAIAETFKPAGVPIKTFKMKTLAERKHVEIGRELYPGDPEKMQSYEQSLRASRKP